jgi:N-methylhydantoinase A
LLEVPVLGRSGLTATPRNGPLIIEEMDATTLVTPDAHARIDDFGNIEIGLQ